MRIQLAVPDRIVSAPILNAALEATTRAARAQQLNGDGPTFSDMMRAGVKWRPESFADGEHFDLPSVVGARGWGDCDDLGPALAAELRAYDPGARCVVEPSGPGRWHVVVVLSDGTRIDPSQIAGMKAKPGVHGAVVRPMACVGGSAIALSPYRGQWFARTDLPWGRAHVASISGDRNLATALDRSIGGAILAGQDLGWEHSRNRSVVGDMFSTLVDAASVAAAPFTGGLSLAAPAALPLLQGLMSGGGGGAAPAAAPAGGGAQSIPLPGGGKAIYNPGGPIIVRF